MRKISIIKDYVTHPKGSCLISFGNTRVLCTASVADNVPGWINGDSEGWLTAEYSMLPGSTFPRTRRERRDVGGRTKEIQRLIGRSLRGAIDRRLIPGYTVTIDCDVIQADGGTRTASITGGYIALALAMKRMVREGKLTDDPMKENIAAISVGTVDGIPVLDLDYREDFRAGVDMNVVGNSRGDFLEVQGTGEDGPFSRKDLDALLDLAQRGIDQLVEIQNSIISE